MSSWFVGNESIHPEWQKTGFDDWAPLHGDGTIALGYSVFNRPFPLKTVLSTTRRDRVFIIQNDGPEARAFATYLVRILRRSGQLQAQGGWTPNMHAEWIPNAEENARFLEGKETARNWAKSAVDLTNYDELMSSTPPKVLRKPKFFSAYLQKHRWPRAVILTKDIEAALDHIGRTVRSKGDAIPCLRFTRFLPPAQGILRPYQPDAWSISPLDASSQSKTPLVLLAYIGSSFV